METGIGPHSRLKMHLELFNSFLEKHSTSAASAYLLEVVSLLMIGPVYEVF